MTSLFDVTLRAPCFSESVGVFKIYRTIISPVVLYGCETRSLTLREERRLRVFENRVLRRVFGPKGDKVTGNEERYIIRN
jgi:hypothetical protein